ncbi:XdhC family protein [Polaromonas sp.]|uniref:XdhC family protein n=1 Tax=Polaromonas sp. TaxID=1869339 RepID=UPI002487827C|nr:XdhC family protein [Polaromonas sp.]MDI1272228.1 XdhC family protein [Polaromonas sp.]
MLGPSLGQCCGGVVHLRFEALGPDDVPALRRRLDNHLQPVALFGGGHVGFALMEVLSLLPFALTWIDSRDGIFPDEFADFSAGPPQGKMRPPGGQGATRSERAWGQISAGPPQGKMRPPGGQGATRSERAWGQISAGPPQGKMRPPGGQGATRSERAWGPNVSCEHSDPVQRAVTDLAPQSRVLIMSFSHAEDLDIVAECLKRQRERGDLPYIGLIGSKTKWATFRHRLEARGFSAEELGHVTCPIGLPGISGKEPEVIAVAVAAQLLHAGRP